MVWKCIPMAYHCKGGLHVHFSITFEGRGKVVVQEGLEVENSIETQIFWVVDLEKQDFNLGKFMQERIYMSE